jgi:hypothetical protein
VILIWLLTILLAAWFGFELGRKWSLGQDELMAEAEEDRQVARGGIKLNRIVFRR